MASGEQQVARCILAMADFMNADKESDTRGKA